MVDTGRTTKQEKSSDEKELYIPSEEAQTLAKNPNLINLLLENLEKRIKHDRPVKLSVFFTGLSSYMKEPINLFQKGESGVGKSYNTIQSLKYFPCEDILLLGGLSPKALIHDYGSLRNQEGQAIDDLPKPEKPQRADFNDRDDYQEAFKEYKKQMKTYMDNFKGSYTLIQLKNKNLVFLETPEYEAFRMLYPILSHDTERTEYKFVDKTGKGQMKTSKVIIEGWPATIFLTVDKKYTEELSTRSFCVTPENTKEKIIAAQKLINQKSAYPWSEDQTDEFIEQIREIIHAIQTWFEVNNADVIIPFPNLHDLFPKELARDMRDFQHFTQFIKSITALHLFQRPIIKMKNKKFLVATCYDVVAALCIYSEIFESTRTGTDQSLLNFYHSILAIKGEWYLKTITEEYNKISPRKASSETMRVKLERLAQIGYVDSQKSEVDKRLNVYRPLVLNIEKSKIHQICESWTLLKSNLETGFNSWSERILQVNPLEINKKNSKEEISIVPIDTIISENYLTNAILILKSMLFNEINITSNDPICGLIFTPDLIPKQENKVKTKQESESCQVLDNFTKQVQNEESEVNYPPQLVCYWCGKPMMDNDWNTPEDDFTEGKPAHLKCTEEKRAQLRDDRNYDNEGE